MTHVVNKDSHVSLEQNNIQVEYYTELIYSFKLAQILHKLSWSDMAPSNKKLR